MEIQTKEQTYLQGLLKERFEAIKSKNGSYSVRAFASKLGISPGTLSLVLLGKRKISRKLARQLATKLMLDPQEKSKLMELFYPCTANAEKNRQDYYVQLSSDQFNVISEWYYFAILNLIKTADFKSDIAWIAKRLNLSEKKIEDAIIRLERLGMLTKDESGNFKRASSKYRTTDDVTSIALRKSHYETLSIASESLENNALNERDFTWVTFAFDTKKMDEAKSLIRKFQDDFLELVQKDSVDNEVYRMAIQLFPLTKLTQGDQYETH